MMPFHIRQVAEHLAGLARDVLGPSGERHIEESALGKALFAGYPDRLARRRSGDRSRVVLASGRGATIARESQVVDGEWLVALDLTSRRADSGPSEALVRMAAGVQVDWIVPTSCSVEHRFDEEQGTVRALAVERYDAIVVRERVVAADAAVRASLLAHAWSTRGPDPATRQLLARVRFAEVTLDLDAMALAAASTARSLAEMRLEEALPWEARQRLTVQAPLLLAVPSGRSTPLTYGEDGSVTASVKLQELFGLAETPRIGPRGEPVTIELLAPNGRVVQTTRDLRSFWERTYPEVRKELRGRYPRHPWPDDPWSATPTHRTVRRR
jgi:ATP-dependent helicase HrpB